MRPEHWRNKEAAVSVEYNLKRFDAELSYANGTHHAFNAYCVNVLGLITLHEDSFLEPARQFSIPTAQSAFYYSLRGFDREFQPDCLGNGY
jgi:hypothetical protein